MDQLVLNKISTEQIPQKTESSRKHITELNDKITNTAPDLLKSSLTKFFSDKENIEKFRPIVNRTSTISLRLLDYFCVNYARENQVVYMVGDKYFDVHSSYKNQLKVFTKKMFDPFKRNSRITLRYDNDRINTTLGQLSFFRWCLINKVLDYVEKNIVSISEDMKKNVGRVFEETITDSLLPEKKRRSSRRNSTMNVTATRVPAAPGINSVIVSFD